MKDMQSFLVFYYIMDKCYFACCQSLNEDEDFYLGGFVSGICPELWGAGRPITNADYSEWKEQTDIPSLNKENIVDAVIHFLDDYEKRYQFDFGNAQETVRQIADREMVEEAFAYAQRMYDEYQYDD